MKKYYSVTYKVSESIYSSNIARAESTEAVTAYYSAYALNGVSEASEHEVETAKRKGMPIVEIENKEEKNK